LKVGGLNRDLESHEPQNTIYITSERMREKGGGGMLTDRQKLAIKMRCIDSMKIQDIAKVLGVHRTTVWRWLSTKEAEKEWRKLVKAEIKRRLPDRSKEFTRLEKALDRAIASGNIKAMLWAQDSYDKYVFRLIKKHMGSQDDHVIR